MLSVGNVVREGQNRGRNRNLRAEAHHDALQTALLRQHNRIHDPEEQCAREHAATQQAIDQVGERRYGQLFRQKDAEEREQYKKQIEKNRPPPDLLLQKGEAETGDGQTKH